MDITQELAKKLGISEEMAAEQLQRDPSLASLITGQAVPKAIPTQASATALDEEAQAKQRGFSTLQELIKNSEPGLSPSAKLAERMPNLSPEARTGLLAQKYSLSEMAEPEKPSPSNLLDSFKQATEMKETRLPEPAIVTAQAEAPKLAEAPGLVETKPKPKKEEFPPPVKKPTLQERIAGEMAGLRTERETAKAERQEQLRRADIGELASLIGRSLAQIGAAAQGMRTGVDMSGVAQQAMVNWDKKREQIYDSYAQQIKELDTQQSQLIRQSERLEDKQERDDARRAAAKLRREELNLRESQFQKQEALKRSVALLNAKVKGDKEEQARIQKEVDDKLKEFETQYKDAADLEGLISELDVADSKTKKKVEAQIQNKAAIIFGKEGIPQEEGWFSSGTNMDELLKLTQSRRASLGQDIDLQKQILYGTRGQAVPAQAPAPTPTQTPPSGKVLSSAKVKEVAQRDGVPEDEARRKLQKLGYTIRD